MQHTIDYKNTKALSDLLVGRTIEKVEMGESYRGKTNDGTMTLDDGTVLHVFGNEGCGGCSNGHFHLTDLNHFDNRIMRAKFKGVEDDEGKWVFEIFVYGAGAKPKAHRVLAVEGRDDSGYYGLGYKITVVPAS